MFTYKSEIFTATRNWLLGRTSETNVRNLDELLNRRTTEGWELVTYAYMPTGFGECSAILVTFRKEK